MSESHIELEPRSMKFMLKILPNFNAETCLMFGLFCASLAKSLIYLTRGLPNDLILFDFHKSRFGKRLWTMSMAHS